MGFSTILLQAGDLQNVDGTQVGQGVDVMTKEIPLWDLVLLGGWTMIPLAILSVMTIYIFVERFLMINKALKDERNFMAKVKEYLVEGKIEAARDLCAQTNNPAARMVEKGISRIGKPMKDIVSSIENVGKLELYQLEKRMGFLATVAGAAALVSAAPAITAVYIRWPVQGNGEQLQRLPVRRREARQWRCSML